MKWYRKAADQGYPEAQNNLAEHYRLGLGVPKDNEEAVKWYRKAADQGNASAQCTLGIHYGMGLGVPKDNVKAFMWLTIAEKSGSKQATSNRAIVAKDMTKPEMLNAMAMALEWTPKKASNIHEMKK